MEAGSYGASAEAGKETGSCRAVYGNPGIYRHQRLLYFVHCADVPGGYGGAEAVSALGADFLCGGTAV